MDGTEEMVTIPRWVLIDLMPLAKGGSATLWRMKHHDHAFAVSFDDLNANDRAIEAAEDALYPDEE